MTLLEDLEAAALDYERRAHVAVIPGVQFDLNAIAGRLRDHAKRLREEMANTNKEACESQSEEVRQHYAVEYLTIRRINGGPL